MEARSRVVEAMAGAVHEAAAILLRGFRNLGSLDVSEKAPADFVSSADLESEAALRAALLRAYPTYGFVTEESAPTVGSEAGIRFIVDPLDGTTNFLRGIPRFAVSVALERDRNVVAGVVYDPMQNELFWAEEGRGAFLGDRRMQVSSGVDLAGALVAVGIPGRTGDPSRYLAVLERLLPAVAGVRRFSPAALDLAYVAAGRFDAFFELGLGVWDVAAGGLLVREAGGVFSEPAGDGRPEVSGDVLASNGHLHEALRALLAETLPRS